MAGTLRQAMVFLGLADDGYEQPQSAPARRPEPDHEARPDEHRQSRLQEDVRSHRGTRETQRGALESVDSAPQGRTVRSARDGSHAVSQVRDSPSEASSRESSRTTQRHDDGEFRAPVTPINRAAAQTESDNELRRITTIHPRSYNDAKVIGESFRENIPVIMNVTDMEVAEAKRLVDFSSGLTFALNGNIERVTEQVFLLTPANLEVLASEDVSAPVHEVAEESPVFNQN